jgi:large subunit ribosomal protein L20
MPRVNRGTTANRRRKKILKAAKGAFGGRRRFYKMAKETVMRGRNFAYRDRRVRKRMFRNLWIVRINAACREGGLSYSVFTHGLKQAGITMNRKMLAYLATEDPAAFAVVLEKVKAAVSA